ncbi:MAG: hypothetical protein PHP64_03045 [Actinomycetota bacterium]|nr:hypothetical protein [Actinomycetota bacterium]
MKSVLLLLTGALCALLVFAGCGGQVKEAKEYMQKADTLFENVDAKLSKASSKSNEIIGKAVTGDTTSLKQKADVIGDITKTFESAVEELERVQAQYKKILDLKGVEDYIEYANAMIKAIDAEIESVKAGNEFLAKVNPIVSAGDWTKLSETIEGSTSEINGITKLTRKAKDSISNAQKIKGKKEL